MDHGRLAALQPWHLGRQRQGRKGDNANCGNGPPDSHAHVILVVNRLQVGSLKSKALVRGSPAYASPTDLDVIYFIAA
jgi:hypothetical protein